MSPDRIALVTGASRGLGAATALALARRGFGVVVTHRGAADTAETVVAAIESAGGSAATMPLDVSDPDSIRGLPERLGELLERRWERTELDGLVNNAGIGRFGALDELTVDDLDAMLATNVRGPFLVIQSLARMLAPGASIVTVSSSASRHAGPGMSMYAATKAAVETMTRNLAVELGPRGIRVNAVAPGPTATDFNGGAMRDDDAMRAFLSGSTALGDVGTPERIADAVAALLGGDLRWVTAERLEVSGGVLL